MKNKAFTMIEMTIAITIMLFLTGLCLAVYKPNTQKPRIFMYTAVKNLTRTNSAIVEQANKSNDSPATKILGMPDTYNIPENAKNDSELSDKINFTVNSSGEYVNGNTGGQDPYCLKVVDLFNVSGSTDCTRRTSPDMTANITLPNNMQFYGLATEWKPIQEEGGNTIYYVKDIMVDIDGPDGMNKLWADRFLLRVYTGDTYTGLVFPAGCSNTTDPAKILYSSNPLSTYCGDSNKTPMNTNSIFSYDVIRASKVGNEGESVKAVIVASGLSPMNADCMALGGFGFYRECIELGVAVDNKCKTSTIGGHSDENPDELPCMTVLRKPGGGSSFMIESLLGDIEDI